MINHKTLTPEQLLGVHLQDTLWLDEEELLQFDLECEQSHEDDQGEKAEPDRT